jgi:hypothetical protein
VEEGMGIYEDTEFADCVLESLLLREKFPEYARRVGNYI